MFNPILCYGTEAFARDAKEAGIDSLLLTDRPPESSAEFREVIGLVFLLARTSTDVRIRAADRTRPDFDD